MVEATGPEEDELVEVSNWTIEHWRQETIKWDDTFKNLTRRSKLVSREERQAICQRAKIEPIPASNPVSKELVEFCLGIYALEDETIDRIICSFNPLEAGFDLNRG